MHVFTARGEKGQITQLKEKRGENTTRDTKECAVSLF